MSYILPRHTFLSCSPLFQLYMMRTMLESLISDKTGAEKKALKVELKDSSIPEFESFHRGSFYYAKLLDLSCKWPQHSVTQPIAIQASCNHFCFSLLCYMDVQ